MSKRKAPLVILLSALFLLGGSGASGQSRFEIARPGLSLSYPKDHGAHPAYRTEWWYFTGNVTSKDQDEYGYELTFFRRGVENPKGLENPSRWTVRDLYLAHFALTDIQNQRFHYEDKISREAIGKAGAKQERLEVWIDEWRAVQKGEAIHLQAESSPEDSDGDLFDAPRNKKIRWKIDLTLTPAKPLVLQGKEGLSVKGPDPGQAS
ncbi:MAG TPA: carotenoid 1,2-hydratase, partial [Candidatus Manganitrophaceae bacterium]